MAGLCDYCGHSLIHYNHDGCYDGYGEEVLTGAPDVCSDRGTPQEGPGAERLS